MRTAHFIDTETVGGAEVLVFELIDVTDEAFLYHFGRGQTADEIKRRGIPNKMLAGYSLYKSILTLPLFIIYFAWVLIRDRVKVLHSHLFGPITAAACSAALSRTRHIGTLHDVYSVEEAPSRTSALWLSAKLGTILVVVSRHMQQRYAELAVHRTFRTQLIYNGVKEIKPHKEARVPLCEELNLNPSAPIFVCVARLVPIKDHQTLITAFAALPRCNLLIVGDGVLGESLAAKAPDNVHFLGFRADVMAVLMASDCFVMSSLSEGLSYSIAEAMACGLPIIATNVGGNQELVIDGENGFLVQTQQPTAFVKVINEVLAGPENLKRLGAASLVRVRSIFSFTNMVRQYAALYDRRKL